MHAYGNVLAISFHFHYLPSLMFWPCHFYLSLHFIATQVYISLLAYFNILAISFLPKPIFHCLPSVIFSPFHCYPGVYFIACLVQHFTHFIPIQGYISLLAYLGVLAMSLLPRCIFQCLPTVIVYQFIATLSHNSLLA